MHGEIKYTTVDSDGSQVYMTRFCYQHTTEHFSEIGGNLIFAGPREYNEWT